MGTVDTIIGNKNVQLFDFEPTTTDFLEDVAFGLSQPAKSLPSKYLYDFEGSRLFDEICRLPEYYPTRTEKAILEASARPVAEAAGEQTTIVELGSGSHHKISLLLDLLSNPAGYVAIDISREFMLSAVEQVKSKFPSLNVSAICADYTQLKELPNELSHSPASKLSFFPGSTIGNFTPQEAERFLKNWSGVLQSGDLFLCGVDLVKDVNVLESAYNDSQGTTAAFNINLLQRINRELGANFQLQQFKHRAIFNSELSRIEMHLVSLCDQDVSIGPSTHRFQFREGETIHTENSYKYTVDRFQEMVKRVGYSPLRLFTDPEDLFSIHLLRVN